MTFRSRVFGEERGLSWASWKAGFHEAKGKDSKLKGQSGQRPKAGGCQAFPGRDRGARVSWKCWRKSWHRRGCRSPGFAHRPRSWYFWVWAALLCGQVAAEDGFSQEELGAGGLGGRFLQWLQSREGLARLDATGEGSCGGSWGSGKQVMCGSRTSLSWRARLCVKVKASAWPPPLTAQLERKPQSSPCWEDGGL